MKKPLNDLVDKIFLERLRRQLNAPPGGDKDFDQAMMVLLGVCNTFRSPIDGLHGLTCAVQAISCLVASGDDEMSGKVIGIACEAIKTSWKRDGVAYLAAIRELEILQMQMDGASKH